MKNRCFLIGLFVLFLTETLPSQYLNKTADIGNRTILTGNLQNDLLIQTNQMTGFKNSDGDDIVVVERKYSPLAAGLFSAVIPGAGQFYTKSYWQSGAFFGAEILTWILYTTYENKGDRQTDAFQQYANEHWSVAQYANWINQNFSMTISVNQQPGLKPWERVNWDELNTVEDLIAGYTPATGFTHKLAPYGDQQYYEMIGKYSQFGGGWDDASAFTKADILANNYGNVTQRFLDYRNMRGDANKFYNIATTVSYVIIANHFFSALEAALNASKINHRIQLQGHIQSRRVYGNLVEFVPTLHMEYGL
jgi:hypothetical protein